jgi:competence protein ComEC
MQNKFAIWGHKKYFIYRLLIPIMVGILLSYHFTLPQILHQILFAIGCIVVCIFYFLPNWFKYQYKILQGIAIYTMLCSIGMFAAYKKNIYHQPNHAALVYQQHAPVWLELTEDIATKPNSYKTEANILYVLKNNKWIKTVGKTIVYFKKDSSHPAPLLTYKQQIITTQLLQPIINAGNPGGFNYKQYTAFNAILYQTFIPNNNYIILPYKQISWFNHFIYQARKKVLQILRQNIATPTELAIAEALLIGFRDDLDRDTVQAYSNTGIVHIIAISGMHLAMIYGLLLALFSFLPQHKITVLLKTICILLVLWLFTLVAGAAPSILRSAIMFSCIAIGNSFNKKASIYHTLGLSAIIILIIQPFSLWDVGFQLSYAAVISIVVFDNFFKRAIYIQQPILKKIWHLCAITMAAQIFTLPLVLYHFHQFPVLFLFTNLIAVPLSGVVLYACIALLLVSGIPIVAIYLGKSIQVALYGLNQLIFWVNNSGMAVWPNIQLTILQAIVLYAILIAGAIWILLKKKTAFFIGLASMLAFVIVRSIDIIVRNTQHKLIVYNVPKHTAIDIVEGRNYFFIGDSILLQDGFLRNFHLKPGRILYRTTPTSTLQYTQFNNHIIQSNNKTIVLLNKPLPKLTNATPVVKADIIIITGNPSIYINQLQQYFACKLLVFDANNTNYKINYWKKDATALGIPFHNVVEQGAFITNL